MIWDFILERYNYLIVIMLMMTGLYIVFSRGNLIKTIIGLNVFQTSVFIFYITVSKVVGGTAPILVGGYGGGHGEGHDGHGDSHGDEHSGKAGHGSETGHGAADHGAEAKPSLEDLQEMADAREAAGELVAHANANNLAEAVESAEDEGQARIEGLHSVPEEADLEANSLLGNAGLGTDDVVNQAAEDLHAAPQQENLAAGHENTIEHTGSHHAEASHEAASHGADHGAEAAGYVADVIYSNPLPHVLILTAIVVGVATTAVGLALAVRIQEAYGSIEEDELEAADYQAEFGQPAPGSAS